MVNPVVNLKPRNQGQPTYQLRWREKAYSEQPGRRYSAAGNGKGIGRVILTRCRGFEGCNILLIQITAFSQTDQLGIFGAVMMRK